MMELTVAFRNFANATKKRDIFVNCSFDYRREATVDAVCQLTVFRALSHLNSTVGAKIVRPLP